MRNKVAERPDRNSVSSLSYRHQVKVFFIAMVVLLAAYYVWPVSNATKITPISGSTLISNVSIVDAVNGETLAHRDVLIEHGWITQIEPHDPSRTLAQGHVIRASGKFLMPGLWDMHTHSWKLSPELHHPLWIANGVTTVRDMSGCMRQDDPFWACAHDRERWNNERAAGERISPRYVEQSSYQTNGGQEVPAGLESFFSLQHQADAEQLVSFYRSEGVTSIKPYSELSREQYQWLAEATKRAGLKLAGHRPLSVSIEQMLASGQDSVEHGRLFLFACHPEAQAFIEHENPLAAYTADYIRSMITQRDTQACNAAMQKMAQSDTYWTPTLTTLAMGAFANHPPSSPDERLRFIPWLVRALIWNPDRANTTRKGVDRDGRYVHLDAFRQAQADVATAQIVGVKLLVGTDSTDTDVFTGFSLHDELAWMVEGGMTPADALKAATYNAAQYSGMLKEAGTVAAGKRADLVLLNANPLDDIKYTSAIDLVILDGRVFDRSALDALIEASAQQASTLRTNLRVLWDMLASPLWRKQLMD